MKWNNDLIRELAEAGGISPVTLKHLVAKLMRELYYGEPEQAGGGGSYLISRDSKGRPTPTIKELAEVIQL
ncbi:hypothetical protein DRO42_07740 [Candidatus Bathyarchaeota archaeon]|nr:MAG: hypothetical protein DRO42_07740 [Candidatus Bathyarchaeota archaeon]